MQITRIYSNKTTDVSTVFSGSAAPKENERKMSNEFKVSLALTGLAIVGLGGFLFHRKMSSAQKITKQEVTQIDEIKSIDKRIKEGRKKLREYMPEVYLGTFEAKSKSIDSEKRMGVNISEKMESVFVLKTENPEKARDVTRIFAQMADCRIKEIETTSEGNLLENLKKEFEESETHFKKTNTRTILFAKYLDDAIPYDNPNEINKMLKDSTVASHTTLFYPSAIPHGHEFDANFTTIKLFEEHKPPVEPKVTTLSKEQESKIKEEIESIDDRAMKKDLASFIGNYDTYKRLRDSIIAEKLGIKSQDNFGAVTNGILLKEPKTEFEENNRFRTEFVINALPHVLNLKLIKITHDPLNPVGTLKQIRKAANEAEENFKNTNIRTIIHVEKLAELLSDQSNDGLEHISFFNRFAENCSERYHSTLLFSTKNPDACECATIAPHRFGVKLDLV